MLHWQTCIRLKVSTRIFRQHTTPLTRTIDKAFGFKSEHTVTELERQDILFARYSEFARGLLASQTADSLRRPPR